MKKDANEMINQFAMQNVSVAYKSEAYNYEAAEDSSLVIEHPYVQLGNTVKSVKFYNRLYKIFEKHLNFIDTNEVTLSENMDSEYVAAYMDHIVYKQRMIRMLLKQMVVKSVLAISVVAAIASFFIF